MTPEEKINYALSLVEGATPGPWKPIEEDLSDDDVRSFYVPVEVVGADGFRVVSWDGGLVPDGVWAIETIMANAQQIALSPLIPAALRLALAARRIIGDQQLTAALDTFLALLPEPPKEGA